jgi:hypothetical protein
LEGAFSAVKAELAALVSVPSCVIIPRKEKKKYYEFEFEYAYAFSPLRGERDAHDCTDGRNFVLFSIFYMLNV